MAAEIPDPEAQTIEDMTNSLQKPGLSESEGSMHLALPEDLIKALDHTAEALDMNPNDFVRSVLAKGLDGMFGAGTLFTELAVTVDDDDAVERFLNRVDEIATSYLPTPEE